MNSGTEYYRRYVAGDDSAMTPLIGEYWDGLLWYLNSITNDLHIAEEAAEEAFVKLAIKKPDFKEKSTFRTWLYAIGRNAVTDILRKQKKGREISAEECHSIADDENAERAFFREEQKLILHRIMGTLSDDYRQVLYLRYFSMFENEEIAAVMHKSKRQIENLLYRAKQALKTALEKEGFTYEGL